MNINTSQDITYTIEYEEESTVKYYVEIEKRHYQIELKEGKIEIRKTAEKIEGETTEEEITVESNNERIATAKIEEGKIKITTKGEEGEAIITVTVGNKQATCTLAVTLPANTSTTAFGTEVRRPTGKTWDTTKVNCYADGAGNTIPVPVGFLPTTVDAEKKSKDEGFVIKNTTDGNEFVWIPVEGMNYTNSTGTITGYNRYDFGKQNGNYTDYSQNLPSDEDESVKNYGGYYIGRYESGIVGYDENSIITPTNNSAPSNIWTGYTQKTGKTMKLVIKPNEQVWNWITRDKAQEVANALYTKESDNVKSKLCSGYGWDTALKFIETKYPSYSVDSTGDNGNTSTVGGTGILQKTGYHKVNNIYDMGGNACEYTSENPNCGRGGYFGDSVVNCPASMRYKNEDNSVWEVRWISHLLVYVN